MLNEEVICGYMWLLRSKVLSRHVLADVTLRPKLSSISKLLLIVHWLKGSTHNTIQYTEKHGETIFLRREVMRILVNPSTEFLIVSMSFLFSEVRI